MNDITGLGKMIEAIAKPTEKLIEEVSKGIGTLYRPRAIRKEGEAEAMKLVAIERAKAEAEEARKAIALTGHMNRIAQLANDDPLIIERAKTRLALQEIEGQLNVEAIAEAATKHLPDQVSEKPISEEWRHRFFKLSADISQKEIQEIWGALLAAEVAAPGRTSIRTLDVLHKISREEAHTFERFARLSAYQPFAGAVKLERANDYGLGKHGISFTDQMRLREAGLLSPEDNVSMRWSAETPFVAIHFSRANFYLTRQAKSPISIAYLPLTVAGRELAGFVNGNPPDGYLTDLVAHWVTQGFNVEKQ